MFAIKKGKVPTFSKLLVSIDGLMKRKLKKNTKDIGVKKKITNKFILLYFFRSERFTYQKLLTQDFELQGKYCSDLIRIFYSRVTCVGILISKVKGTKIITDDYIWPNIVRVQVKG